MDSLVSNMLFNSYIMGLMVCIVLSKINGSNEMKKISFLLTISTLIVLAGCGKGSDYTPAADDSGERIFSTVCTECHKPLSGDVAILLSEKMANKDAIISKVQSGSMKMPAFKNIQGEAADRLAEYVLAHSDTKK